MAHNLTETSTWDANVPVPDPGDARTAASVVQFAQPLANRLTRLLEQTPALVTLTGWQIPLTLFRPVSTVGTTNLDNWIQFIPNPVAVGSLAAMVQHKNTAAVSSMAADISSYLGLGQTITNVTMRCNGNIFAQAAHGALPATKPFVRFVEISPTTGLVTYLASQQDTSGTVGAYEVNHNVSLTVNRSFSPSNRYAIIVDGEEGANSIVDYFGVISINVGWTKAHDSP